MVFQTKYTPELFKNALKRHIPKTTKEIADIVGCERSTAERILNTAGYASKVSSSHGFHAWILITDTGSIPHEYEWDKRREKYLDILDQAQGAQIFRIGEKHDEFVLDINQKLYNLYNYFYLKQAYDFDKLCAYIQKTIDERVSGMGRSLGAEYSSFVAHRRYQYEKHMEELEKEMEEDVGEEVQ